jgi:hypothetical protein
MDRDHLKIFSPLGKKLPVRLTLCRWSARSCLCPCSQPAISGLLFLSVLKLCKPVLNDRQLLTRDLLFVALEHHEALAVG